MTVSDEMLLSAITGFEHIVRSNGPTDVDDVNQLQSILIYLVTSFGA